MFDFAEITKEMSAAEILNYYRNLYYAEPQVTERGIVANAINDYLTASVKEVVRCRNCKYCESFVDDFGVDKYFCGYFCGSQRTDPNGYCYRGRKSVPIK